METNEKIVRNVLSESELEEFSRVDLLPTSFLTKGLLATGAVFTGFWYNTGLGAYVNIDSSKWAYAQKTKISEALMFKVYLDSNKNAIFYADFLGVKRDLNCKRRLTFGPVGLSEDDPMPAVLNWQPNSDNATQFTLKDDDWDDLVGVGSGNKKLLYLRGTTDNTSWKFRVINHVALNPTEQAIYDHYVAKYDEYKLYVM